MDDETKTELAAKHSWVDPTLGYPSKGLIDGVREIESRYVAIKHGGSHKAVPWLQAYHSKPLEHVDGLDWSMFIIKYEGVVDGQHYYWGQYVEGLGFVHVMVAADHVRELTGTEKKRLSGKEMAMVGSHSGKESYRFNLPQM